MTLTQILQKIKSVFYTKSEIDSNVVHNSGDETIDGVKDFTSNQKMKGLVINPNAPTRREIYGQTEGVISSYGAGTVPESNINPYRFYVGKARNYASAPIVFDTAMSTTGGTSLTLRSASNESENVLDHRVNIGTSVTDNSDGTKTRNAYVQFYNTNELRSNKNNYCNLGTPSYKWADVNTVLLNGKTPELIEEQGDGYIRYSNGVQICWGLVVPYTEGKWEMSYPKPFKETPSCIGNNDSYFNNFIISVQTFSTDTKAVFMATAFNGGAVGFSGQAVRYMAIGKWK